MADKKYKVIISDRAKRMLGTHIRFMSQINKDAAVTKKKELVTAMRSLEFMPQDCTSESFTGSKRIEIKKDRESGVCAGLRSFAIKCNSRGFSE